jgi:Ni/Co efflux regulator RcnB
LRRRALPTLGDAMGHRSTYRVLAVLAGVTALAAPLTASSPAKNPPLCGFWPVNFRQIDDRHHISCAEAKRVLLQLRGHRDTIPMVCGRPRDVHGWHLRNTTRGYSATFNRYSRGRVVFTYQRMQNPWRQWCPPIGDEGAGV